MLDPVLTRLPGIRAVMVDLDGTMVDTLGDFQVALNGMLAEWQLPRVERWAVELAVGKGSEHLVRTVLARQRALVDAGPRDGAPVRTVDEASFDAAMARYQHHYRQGNGQHSAVYAGVVEGLAMLKAKGLPLACLTNKPVEFAKALLELKALDSYFPWVFGGDSFARKKPDPLPLIKTCDALGLPTAQVLMVGDSENDAFAASAAGCPVALVTYGYNHGQPIRSVKADAWVDSLLQLG
ncbi:phosphoglycolate phosphatase [Hydrogenophaga crassostreae]|uniref:Phosphoglycolate phosphatase n=1 Tax=Hydrogenophaga crassostreae TaxID=1763535 RepID=A0A162SQD0_9BURK|nr:phosphoglycolate phosphatase [Hydrogenophaga crassostreae]AOW15009.1 phosphoglycolate phosphatase [Hydrogenophaga crassostreae]OAD39462.1 phosphoglycolate phosphatase [Hydrogenophaga crassostreae]